jgi:hypothetical protein
MTARLRISDDLSLPADVVTSTTVVYGGKGMGKTNLGSVLIEELSKALLRWALLDPMGVAWGLRHSKDGKGPGVSCLVLGGAHGDIPIEPTGGAVVADLVVDEAVNTIIDFSRHPDGKMWSNGERVRFVTDYAIRLFERQGQLIGGRRREPLLQILDEAARYIPQTIPSGAIDLARCVGAWEQICEEGRNIGLGVAFLTQRSARMAKSVSELADVMFAFRTIGPNSLDAVLDWLGQHVEKSKVRVLAEQVRQLDVGQALVVSPGWLKAEAIVRIRQRETFDSSATPKAGQKAARVTGQAAKPDLAAYQAKMAETIERASANDPKVLRARIADLEKQIRTARPQVATVADPKAIERAVAVAMTTRDALRKDERARIRRTLDEIKVLANTAENAIGRIEANVGEFGSYLSTTEKIEAKGSPELARALDGIDRHFSARRGGKTEAANQVAATARAAGVRVWTTPRDTRGDSSLPVGERKILTAIAQNDGADREQLTVLTGYKKSSRDAYLQRLQSKGFVAIDGRNLQATEEGLAALGAFEPLPTGDRLREYWLARLPEGEVKILTIVCHAYPRPIARDDIDAGYQKSSRDAYLQRLAAKKLVTTTRGTVMASPNLFDRYDDR